MTNLSPVQRVLDASSDRDNPPAEALADLFDRIRRIAVVGLSRDPEKAARRVPSYLAAKGYDVVPINPNAQRILGKDALPDLDALDEPVDMVMVFRPSDQAGRFVTQAAARAERPAIWLQEGITADEEVDRARASGLIVVQDLCSYKIHQALQGAEPAG